ncbi:hypothetical protein [Halomonas stenophila]
MCGVWGGIVAGIFGQTALGASPGGSLASQLAPWSAYSLP